MGREIAAIAVVEQEAQPHRIAGGEPDVAAGFGDQPARMASGGIAGELAVAQVQVTRQEAGRLGAAREIPARGAGEDHVSRAFLGR